jgi:hypothetical protein
MYQKSPILPVNTLPTMYDLPSENPEEMGLPDKFHDLQPHLFLIDIPISFGYSVCRVPSI